MKTKRIERMSKGIKTILSVFAAVLMIASVFVPAVTASMVPISFEATLHPGEMANEHKDVTIPTSPPKVDLLFTFDLTGSMRPTIDAAKANAITLMNQLSATGVDYNFAVGSYMDYPHSYSSFGYTATYGESPSTFPGVASDYAYVLNQSMTSDQSLVSAKINSLALGNGVDGPQDYTRILYESYADMSVGWRPGAKKIIINFADFEPHDNNLNEGVPGMSGVVSTGGDPGRDEIMGTGDDLDLQTVLAEMKANHVMLLEAHVYASPRWDYWAGLTGGKRFTISSANFVSDVKAAILDAVETVSVNSLHLAASSGYESWLTLVSPASYPTVSAGTSVPFDLTLTVPAGTSPGDYIFSVSALDSTGVSYGDQTVTIHVPSANEVPVVDAGSDVTINEGDSFSGAGSFTDPDNDSWTATVDYGDGAGLLVLTGKNFNLAHTYPDNGVYSMIVTVNDDKGGVGTDIVQVTVNNVVPVVGPIVLPVEPQLINTAVSVSSPFTDAGTLDTHTAEWNFGDGATSAGVVAESGGSGTVTGGHTYTLTGIYTVSLTVTDKDGGVGTATAEQYVVVYDPNGGFVTGGGWINSSAGAYAADPTLSGKANFGFVSKYQKGSNTPIGNTEFQFHAGNLNFHSLSYNLGSLVVAGQKAIYKGIGQINGGTEQYKFMVSAIDNGASGDTFRIKITDMSGVVVYDNQVAGSKDENADPTTTIQGGNIVIHKGK